jgi:chemotaxis signal transduction protein
MSGNLSSAETPTETEDERRNWVEFVRVHLGHDYALELGRVERILRDPSVTPVPGTGDGIAGVTNLGSQIPVVVDGRALLDLPKRSPDAESALLLLDREEARPSGLLVDGVEGIEAHHVEELQAPEDCENWNPAVGRRWFRAVVVGGDENAGSSENADFDGSAESDRLTGVFDLDALLVGARGQA